MKRNTNRFKSIPMLLGSVSASASVRAHAYSTALGSTGPNASSCANVSTVAVAHTSAKAIHMHVKAQRRTHMPLGQNLIVHIRIHMRIGMQMHMQLPLQFRARYGVGG